MKRLICLALTALMLLAVVPASAVDYLYIATGGTSGTYYALGGELARPDGSDMGKEDLVACDPDVIFVVYMAYAGDDPDAVRAEQRSAIQDDPALASLSAVQSGRVHLIMLGDMYASGPRTIDGIRTLAQGMYPGLEL